MSKAVIVSAVRTPVGRYGGALKDVQAVDLAATAVKESLCRASVDPGDVDEVILGHILVNGETPNIARLASIKAGLPVEVPAYTLDRQCSSGLQAIINASLLIDTDNANVVVAGGVESMSNMEYYVLGARWGLRLGNGVFYDRWDRAMEVDNCNDVFGACAGMIGTAENVAEKFGISREEADEFAVRSHRNAIAAIESGRFADEIVPIEIPQRRGPALVFDRDEHPRADTTTEALSKLRPILSDGIVTAGNASGMNDGAAACVVMSEDEAKRRGLEPLGRIVAWSAAGVHPHYMGIGPVQAVTKALEKANLTMDDMDLIELNEAFASQALAVLKELGVKDREKVNVNGSGVSLGHPVGATGARMMATLLHEMKRRYARYGLNTMCIGGGMGLAAVIERP
jgi:acetyl-CoA C-acetyltransferase